MLMLISGKTGTGKPILPRRWALQPVAPDTGRSLGMMCWVQERLCGLGGAWIPGAQFILKCQQRNNVLFSNRFNIKQLYFKLINSFVHFYASLHRAEFEFMFYLLPSRHDRIEELIKFGAVIRMFQMTQLVRDNIVNALLGRSDQVCIESYCALI